MQVSEYFCKVLSAECSFTLEINLALNGQKILAELSVFWKPYSQIVLVFPLLNYLIRDHNIYANHVNLLLMVTVSLDGLCLTGEH